MSEDKNNFFYWQAIFSAAVGGTFPTLMVLAIGLTAGQGKLPEVTWWFGLLLMGFLGACIGFFWQEVDLKKAFFIGLGLPSLIHTGTTAYSETQYRNHQEHASFVVSSAYAVIGGGVIGDGPIGDSGTDAARRDPTILKIIPEKNMPAYAVDFFTAGKFRNTIVINYSLNSVKEIVVPNSTDSLEISIVGDNSRSDRIIIPTDPDTAMVLKVHLEKETWSGFLNALGFLRASAYKITVEKTLERVRYLTDQKGNYITDEKGTRLIIQ